MKNLIIVEPHVIEKVTGLKVSLTIDGAEHLKLEEPKGMWTIDDIYDNTPDKDGKKQIISVKSGEIFSTVFIPQDNETVKVKVYRTVCPDIIRAWEEDPKAEFIFLPDSNNERVLEEVKCKLAANHWAMFSDQKLFDVAIEINARHQKLKAVNEKTIEAYQLLNYKGYHQDDKYEDLLKSVSAEVEKEMDFCIEKMNIVKKISGNDFNQDIQVSKLYKKFRGVIEEKSEKMNVKIADNRTAFMFSYEPINWRDVEIVKDTEAEAVHVFKEALQMHLDVHDIKDPIDETKIVITSRKLLSDGTQETKENPGTPDSEGENGKSASSIGEH